MLRDRSSHPRRDRGLYGVGPPDDPGERGPGDEAPKREGVHLPLVPATVAARLYAAASVGAQRRSHRR